MFSDSYKTVYYVNSHSLSKENNNEKPIIIFSCSPRTES